MPTPQAPPVQKHPTQTKTLLYAGIAAAVVAAIIAGVYLFSGKSARDLNPEMTTRVLQVPFTQISYPGLSPDGKWIAFPAADANGKWDIYYMHSQEGDPKRITNDSSDFIQQVADISPDGSRIVYSRMNKRSNRFELLVISSLGGNGKTIAEGGVLARWSPDSRRVGYVKGGDQPFRSESGLYEFWTVGADGQDNRREFTDTIGLTRQSRFSWCFSPDGASIGWIRTNDRAFQSIIIHNLATGEERPLVGGDERMDDISWTSNNEIIYSSNKSGNTNLWTIPADGGTPRQITKGSGPDIGMKVSADGRSLLYLQQQRIGNVWLGSLKTGSARQLTFDERQISTPMISPDGRRVAFVMADPDPLKLGSGIYVMSRDGGDRRRITPEREIATFAAWSPDGKRIAYRYVESTDSTTAVEIRVIDAVNPGTPKTIARDTTLGLWGWMNDNTIICATYREINRSYLVSVDDTVRKQLIGDSTIAIPRLGGKYLMYTDFRDTAHTRNEIGKVDGKTLEELLRGPDASITPMFPGNPRSVPRGSMPWASWTFYDELNDFIGIWKNGTEMWKYNFVTGREEKIAAQFPGFRQGVTAGVSADGTELVYADQRLSAKLVMIENLFR